MAANDLLSEDYKVDLEVFEGPPDLLLYLIRRDELDIYDIPIGRITEQYMKYIEMMRQLNLDVAGEFIVMAATLMVIKSRMLLPVDRRTAEDVGEEEWVDPRLDLVRQLVEYKKFKDAAGKLAEYELRQMESFDYGGGRPKFEKTQADKANAIADLGLFLNLFFHGLGILSFSSAAAHHSSGASSGLSAGSSLLGRIVIS